MFKWKRIFRVLNIVVALSLLLQLAIPLLENPVVAYAAPLPPHPPSLSRTAPAQPASPSDIQVLLNLLVRQVVTANGWTVVSLTSQLNPTDASASRQSGTRQWQLQILDENQQSLSLAGTLKDEITAQAQGNLISNAELVLNGTLHAANVALDLSSAVENDGATAKSASHAALTLTRNGKTSTTNISSTGETKPLAYNLNQSITHSTMDRDGKSGESTQTITARNLGRGESEVWLQVEGKGDAATNLSQHLFQRVSGISVMQYLDRFDLKTADNQYSLQAPTGMTGTLDGELNFAITLVDRNGKTIKLSQGKPPQSFNLPGRRVPGLAMPLPMDDGDPRAVESVPLADEESGRRSGGVPPASGPCDFGRSLLGIGATASLTAGGAGLAFLAGVTAAATAGAVALGVAAIAVTIASGIALYQMATGNPCNADPYFVGPDSRPNMDTIKSAPVQITRVTGGLVTPTASVSFANAVSARTDASVEYRDSARVFIGGALPPSATAIGSWNWDNNRAFRGAPSHTQPRSDSPQLHYFIHAAPPLSASADDDIVQYVYLDPQNPPSEIYLQFYIGDGDGEHRAYWGADRIQTGGVPGTASLYPMGALPDKGTWVRLRIPTGKLGLVGQPINGILYGAHGGQTWWGPTTTSNRQTDAAPDQLALDETLALPATQPGAQIAFRLSQATPLMIEIVEASGARVRTLAQNETRQPIYQVATWDAKNDSGALVQDKPYRVRFSTGGKIVADAPVTISPFVANISSPGAFSIARGVDVPIFGEAYGDQFQRYVVEYGAGLSPTDWKTLIDAAAPTLVPSARALSHIRAGNHANWNVGLDEFTPWKETGLAGVYTLRLRVIGKDGREASDTAPIIVGRLASFPDGGVIASPDGKARLIVPPLATQNSFALLALIPLAQVSTDDTWRQTLPGDRKLAGTVYEIFPADEHFRQDIALELPYDANSPSNKLGVMLGDGNAWRYLGGAVDSQRQTIRVSLREFGGIRALVAPFIADNFGSPNPFNPPATPLALNMPNPAPAIAMSRAPFAFYSDLETNAGEWAALDVAGTHLSRAQGAEAGLADGGAALKVTRRVGGVRLVRVRTTPYDAAKYPILQFDYRLPSDYAPDLFLRSNSVWWQLRMGTSHLMTRDFRTLFAPRLIADNAWHHYQIDVLALLRQELPNATNFQIDGLVLGQIQPIAFRQFVPVDDGAVGSAYYVTNFTALAPTNANNLAFTVTPPGNARAYAFALDQKMDTLPGTNAASASNSINANLPSRASDGAWYLHVRAQNASGQWSAATHLPVLIDRQPPQIGKPDPAPNGAGSPNSIQAPVRDESSGLDVTKLQLQIDGQRYNLGRGFRYNAEARVVQINPVQLEPALPFIANGQKVELALSGMSDYAGNPLSGPFVWSFTADRPIVRGNEFRQLTVKGGEASTLSPNGAQAAFVSNRSGAQKVWVMRADDYEEKSNSARQLTSTSARESDPAWSPDAKLIAFVADTNGAPQIWVAAPDGGGAHALTAGEGTVASPTWSPDARTIAFVREGNLWQVNADGSAAHALTNYPERPFKSVRWQPGGSLLAVDFKLYQETIDLYNPATGEVRSLTEGGQERDPEWLNASTLLYSAPAAPNQPDAVWQINLDGSGAAILNGSGQPGVSDLQAASARDGSALALVSTRIGARNIFLRANLQLARFDVSPATGAPVGTPMQIAYALPTDARVTLEIAGVKALLNQTQQTKGLKTTTWDGTDGNGKPVPPGDYALKLTAQVAGGGDPLTRFATARVLDASNIGTLQLQINQWMNTPLKESSGLRVAVYPRGARGQPVAEADAEITPAFKLPAGDYDVVVSRNDAQRELNIRVDAGKTTPQAFDLQLGGLQVTLLSAPGRPITGNVYMAVTRSDDPLHARIAEQFASVPGFVLPAGRYDLLAEY